jgi:hypothetical protein
MLANAGVDVAFHDTYGFAVFGFYCFSITNLTKGVAGRHWVFLVQVFVFVIYLSSVSHMNGLIIFLFLINLGMTPFNVTLFQKPRIGCIVS